MSKSIWAVCHMRCSLWESGCTMLTEKWEMSFNVFSLQYHASKFHSRLWKTNHQMCVKLLLWSVGIWESYAIYFVEVKLTMPFKDENIHACNKIIYAVLCVKSFYWFQCVPAPISPPSYPSPLVYCQEFLLGCARSSICQKKPPSYDHIADGFQK